MTWDPWLIVWLWVCLSFGLLLVTPLVATWVVQGEYKRAGLLAVAFVLMVGATPTHASVPPPAGGTAIGASNTVVACTAGAAIYYAFAYSDFGVWDGVCPAGASINCGNNSTMPSNGNPPAWVQSGTCYEMASGGGGSSTPPIVILPPLSAADGGLISAAIVACWGSAFAFRAIRAALNSGHSS
jgi:hypothetical protein